MVQGGFLTFEGDGIISFLLLLLLFKGLFLLELLLVHGIIFGADVEAAGAGGGTQLTGSHINISSNWPRVNLIRSMPQSI